ncbi:hypothetical protein [Qipengyuania sp. MTN3-11]|uniref:hypothetical protein n=1 Tax=Qipengyuania sp. MTN3-11 TaxID=3056557 RepID=UPI0036F2DCA6
MILRATSGWQTITADLALILFLITAQAVSEPEPEQKPTLARSEPGAPVESTGALAVHRPAIGEDMGEWLRSAAIDERQVATISIDYAPGERAVALREADRLLASAEAEAVDARLIVAPGPETRAIVTIDYFRSSMAGTDFAE